MKRTYILNQLEKTKDLKILRANLTKCHPYDIAKVFPILNEEKRKKLYAIFSDEKLADIFSYLDDSSKYLLELNNEKIADIIEEMEPDDAADTLAEMSESASDTVYELLEKETQEEIDALTKYEEDTAGAIMNTHFIWFPAGIDIKVAMKTIVQEAPKVETINTSFVVDSGGRLLGTINLKKLIVTKSPCIIDRIMNTNFQWANVEQDVEEVVKTIKDYDVYELPVLENGILKGIITMDDAADALIEEAEEDYAKFAGLTEEEETNESVFKSIKKRLPWLSILLIVDIFVTIIISRFEYLFAIDSMTILVIFQPMILGLAGNCGTQSLAVTIRKISSNQLDSQKTIITHIGRELSLGFITGFVLGIISFILTLLVLLLKQNNSQNMFVLAAVVSVAIFISITVANTIGSLIPVVLYKFGVDPAVASGPFITTINDISSITIYFTLATLLIYNFL